MDKEITNHKTDNTPLDIQQPNEHTPPVIPNEFYQFRFTKEELNDLHRLQKRRFLKKPFILTLLCIVLFIESYLYASSFMGGLTLGILLNVATSYLKGYVSYCKNWKKNVNRICDSTYIYEVYTDYIDITIYHKNELTRKSKYYFTDIEQIQQLGNWLTLQIGGSGFLFKQNELKSDSTILTYIHKNPSKTITDRMPFKQKILSNLLFIASLLSITGALALTNILSKRNGLSTENMWTFFLFTPITIASIVYGLILKSKGYRYKKNVITGIIMTFLLCIYGSFTFIF